jgi:hypothetical protein
MLSWASELSILTRRGAFSRKEHAPCAAGQRSLVKNVGMINGSRLFCLRISFEAVENEQLSETRRRRAVVGTVEPGAEFIPKRFKTNSNKNAGFLESPSLT